MTFRDAFTCTGTQKERWHEQPGAQEMIVVDNTFPHLCRWVLRHGWMEIGYDEYSQSFIRVLDIGGFI